MKNIYKKLLIIAITLLTLSCDTRYKTSDFKNCVIIKQHCGWDNLDGGCYHVKDLKTGTVIRMNVDIRDCDVYNLGDTIK